MEHSVARPQSKGTLLYLFALPPSQFTHEVVTSSTIEASCCTETLHSTSRKHKDRSLWQWNHQGATNELHTINKMSQSTSQMATIKHHLAAEGCEWNSIHHTPPFRGLWKTAVNSMKYHLLRTRGSHVATYGELCTLLSEIDVCLNSRILCALSDNPSNPTYLSLGHFHIGEPITQLPAIDVTNVKINRLSRWQMYQQQVQQFWQCWSTDYLQSTNNGIHGWGQHPTSSQMTSS